MRLSDLNIDDYQVVVTPTELKKELPLPESVRELVTNSRQTVKDILDGKDDRLFAVVGPCSIHDTELALEYGKRLKALADAVSEQIFIIMRVYFEKPRTTVGWKGLINDPHLNGSFEIEDGLRKARKLLIDLSEIGLPLATEALDPISPQYLQDTITWTAIGARTTESQTHREMSSGLSSPVGFKNGTDGSLDVAVNAMKSVVSGHAFLGINPQGQVAITKTKGNQYGHVVLRGGGGKPNYDSVSITLCEQALEKSKLPTNIVVDCSHANSNKDHNVQPLVLDDIAHQIKDGNRS
ncbi:MAG: 3-deoxy-7-phosphoheptulonate synthase, partial [Gammaproteobacteria bacterium]|nr:3-deoxy-7-phosphoheptulonate synthase [Gammaproteobacteria bacterium]